MPTVKANMNAAAAMPLIVDRQVATEEIETIYPKVDGQSVTMLLSPHAIRNQKAKGGGHGDHWDRQLFALWDGVHRMQRPTGRTEVVGVREPTRSPSFLVL
jgi:hypothetical protein